MPAEIIDRRKHKRYLLKSGAIAIFMPHPIKLVPIINIGLGGLSAKHISKDEESFDYKELSIITNREPEKLSSLPFQVVSDFCVSCLFLVCQIIYFLCFIGV